MGDETRILDSRKIRTGTATYNLILSREDFSSIFPGMFRYCVSLIMNGQLSLVFRTNTFEYTPGYPGDAEQVSREKMNEWERILLEDPGRLIPPVKEHDPVNPRLSRVEVVVLQGSPRADGNCGFIAGWVMEAARNAGKTVHVFFPHDMELHSCIGCYQCFNSGACTFRDDMEEILYAIRNAELVAICSPVYTNTVPAGLKTVFDRSLPYHAALTLGILENRPKGLLFAVAGRKGVSNFTCTKRVVRAFMEISGIIPAGEILFDDMDNRFSVKNIEEAESDVKTLVHQSIRL